MLLRGNNWYRLSRRNIVRVKLKNGTKNACFLHCLLVSLARGWTRTSSKPFARADVVAPEAAVPAIPAGARDGAPIARPAGDRNQSCAGRIVGRSQAGSRGRG